MPFLLKTVTLQDNLQKQATDPAPFGPGFSEGEVKDAVRMEVWATGIKDPGPDYCEFTLFNQHNTAIANRRVEGY